jgi:5-methylcytosine-specific restriction endonuclease McrA
MLKRRVDKFDEIRAYEKGRAKLPHRVAARKEYQAKYPPAVKEAHQAWIKRNPEKRKAQIMLNNAIRDGKIEKSKCCQVCGREGRIEGHHVDYSKPLEVTWLCRQHHFDAHG